MTLKPDGSYYSGMSHEEYVLADRVPSVALASEGGAESATDRVDDFGEDIIRSASPAQRVLLVTVDLAGSPSLARQKHSA